MSLCRPTRSDWPARASTARLRVWSVDRGNLRFDRCRGPAPRAGRWAYQLTQHCYGWCNDTARHSSHSGNRAATHAGLIFDRQGGRHRHCDPLHLAIRRRAHRLVTGRWLLPDRRAGARGDHVLADRTPVRGALVCVGPRSRADTLAGGPHAQYPGRQHHAVYLWGCIEPRHGANQTQ